MIDTGMDIGRRIKARRIAAAIRSLDGNAQDARRFSDAEWSMADALSRAKTCGNCKGTKHVLMCDGKLARCHVCAGSGKIAIAPKKTPSEVTRALVIELLSRPEAPEVDRGEPRDEDVPA